MGTYTQTRSTKSDSQDTWLMFITLPRTVKISSVICIIDTPGNLMASYQSVRNFLKGFKLFP
jgi:hypothetical protein